MKRLSRIGLCATLGLVMAGCGGSCRQAPRQAEQQLPTLEGPDGREYVLLARGPNQPFFDAKGSLEKVEYDRNGDGKPDQVAWHHGSRFPQLVENDDDFDGHTDRWIYYNASGVLVKVGASRSGKDKPDYWVYPGPGGRAERQEYDDDGDGKPDRIEILDADGRVTQVQVDADRDGRIDRWQNWSQGKLVSEDLDTDGDGKPDKRLRFGPKGEVVALEPYPAR
jgi:hypothetical protein